MDNQARIRRAQGNRLRILRIAAGFPSARAAALAAGWPESTYRAHEGGTRTISPADAAAYVLHFIRAGAKGDNFTGRWIIYGDDDDLTASLDDLVAGETADFKRRAMEAILKLKKR